MEFSPDPPPGPSGLPHRVHQQVAPGSLLLRLRTSPNRDGPLDGAWWPNSHDVIGELPALISALTKHLGPFTRVGLDTEAWDTDATRLVVDGRVIHLDWSPVADDTVLLTRGEQDHFVLLVVPSEADRDAAVAAMARAVSAENTAGAGQILIETGVHAAAELPE